MICGTFFLWVRIEAIKAVNEVYVRNEYTDLLGLCFYPTWQTILKKAMLDIEYHL
jgi:hypothetical protein